MALAWDEKFYTEVANMTPEAARALVQSRNQRPNQDAALALRLSANAQPGTVNDVTIDRTVTFTELSEELPDGTRRLLREARYADLLQMRSDARGRK